MEGGSTSGKMFGTKRRRFVLVFPLFFNLALNKEATVTDFWDRGEGAGCWSHPS